jgi:hypothetical protein|uniref:Uncharacterized protein n=1 Tax=Siphoviridae sp. ctGyV19 TaxID=2826225 RepID=A0A8S5MVK1_9CAUD|nr:MAG TPA: hypothetical protein [Siphoviridae sp. ctGyV19]
MYKELIIYRNELKNTRVPKYKFVGIVTEILLSKDVFIKNAEIASFLKTAFNIDYKDYVMKSRTMIVARTSRIIHNLENDEYVIYKRKLFQFISDELERLQTEEQKKEKNQFDGWINNDK